MTAAQHPARIVHSAGTDISPQQSELHQIKLGAATAEAFEFAGDRFKRLDCRGELSSFESGEAARH